MFSAVKEAGRRQKNTFSVFLQDKKGSKSTQSAESDVCLSIDE
jgi:hypothetical protein